MSAIPLACNVQGDYGYKIIHVDRSATIRELITAAVSGVEGYLVAKFPDGTEFDAKIHGAEDCLDHAATIGAIELMEMETIDISVR